VGRVLDHLSDGEFPAFVSGLSKGSLCPGREAWLFCRGGGMGAEFSDTPDGIRPLEAGNLAGVGKLAIYVCDQSGDSELAG